MLKRPLIEIERLESSAIYPDTVGQAFTICRLEADSLRLTVELR